MSDATLFLALDTAREAGERGLSSVAVGDTVEVVALRLEADLAGWLRAVGICEGDRVTVLRRAVFGGPIHVRMSSGGEFALHRALAASVITRVSFT
jgi:ferrous iron transport protein A